MTEPLNQFIVALLLQHKCSDLVEHKHRDFILDFVRAHERPFDRTHLHGHLTASAFIVNPNATRTLLGFHRKLNRWLQLGGHGEASETNPTQVAIREATEESGMEALSLHPSAPRPLDLDVHEIPERKGIPMHNHLDIRYLLVAPRDAKPLLRPDEHLQMQWFSWDDALVLSMDANMRRGLLKSYHLCRAKALT